ncbi:MAG: tetratricopeptide repeat protein [Candidatus Omnitrophica bacterium]|nr:tetratricopeptide repeat protein [Candidatus Omnitrophota bacterium]
MRYVALMMCVFMMFGFSGSLRDKIARGNAHFEKAEYENALEAYTDAQLHDPHNPQLFFNMGDVFYSERKYDEAMNMYEKAMEKGDPELEFQSQYNIGCTLYRQGKLKESLDAFKAALERDPEDEDTKYNVEFVEQKIKEMINQAQKRMEQQQSQSQSEQNEEQAQRSQSASESDEQPDGSDEQQAAASEDKQEQEGEEQAQVGQDEKQQGDQGQQGEQEEKKNEQESRGQQDSHGQAVAGHQMSKEEAARYLDMLETDDRMRPQQEKQQPYGNFRLEKDW